MVRHALLIGVALAGCGRAPLSESGQELTADRIRMHIEAAGVAGLWAGSEPIYESVVLPTFYERRFFRPAWSDEDGPTKSADDLVLALRRADLEGLRSVDYHLAGIETALAEVRAGVTSGSALVADRWAELDLLLTDAFLVYGTHLLAGRVNPETLIPEWVAHRRIDDIAAALEKGIASDKITATLEALAPPQRGYLRLREALARYRAVAARGGWPETPDGVPLVRGDRDPRVAALRERLRLENDLGPADKGAEDLFDEELEQSLWLFQRSHGLPANGATSAATRAELNVPVERRVEQLELNLERWRWLPKNLGRRHIIVNIAAYELEVVDQGAVVLAMPVVVGRLYNRTPVLSGMMRSLVLNPYWYVPRNIATEELLPKVAKDPLYLARNNVQVFRASGPNAGDVVDPGTVNWPAITPDTFPFSLRQDPGPLNALGRVKFIFNNRFNVYLHDTPSRALFEETQRDFSHGCVRIQDPLELAAYLLRSTPGWSPEAIRGALKQGEQQTVKLPEPIPVHLLYWTAWADEDGSIQFRRDIHERDAPLLIALRASPTSN